jgi:hypothetical protein
MPQRSVKRPRSRFVTRDDLFSLGRAYWAHLDALEVSQFQLRGSNQRRILEAKVSRWLSVLLFVATLVLFLRVVLEFVPQKSIAAEIIARLSTVGLTWTFQK